MSTLWAIPLKMEPHGKVDFYFINPLLCVGELKAYNVVDFMSVRAVVILGPLPHQHFVVLLLRDVDHVHLSH